MIVRLPLAVASCNNNKRGRMVKFGIGQPVRRFEDQRLVTGAGRYCDDIKLADQTYGYVVRSPYAHALIAKLDTSAAKEVSGVLGVYTVEDLDADNIGNLPCLAAIPNKDGSPMKAPPRPALARSKVRHVGDPVAFIVAETLDAARKAADSLTIDYEALDPVVETGNALAPTAAQVWDEAPGNLCVDWHVGDEAATDVAFTKAKHVVRRRLINNRLIVSSMEGRVAIGEYDTDKDQLILTASTQGVHALKKILADAVFKVPSDKMRVITPDVGGGFGMKLFLYPEYVLCLFAARRLKRPVKWTSDRSEAFLSDTQGRDHISEAELALDEVGNFLGLRVNSIVNLGAYLSNYSPFVATAAGSPMLAGCYKTPAISVSVKAVFTNTVPVDAYRGAGRPEANYVMERMVQAAADELKIDPAELRRRNFITPAEMPYTTALDMTYDSGDFPATMAKAMRMADWDGFAQRKAASERQGKQRGRGMAYYIEACAGGAPENARLEFSDNKVRLLIGTQTNGQGHETAYRQILVETLGIAPDQIDVVQGDSAVIKTGGGTGGSRSVPVGGTAVQVVAETVIKKGKKIAAEMLEAAPTNIDYHEGIFRISGTNRTATLFDVAAAGKRGVAKDDVQGGLDSTEGFKPTASTFPNGCHIVEVEVDPETGGVVFDRYTICDDFGRMINPLLLEGQVHGGIVQGIGQAVSEATIYDPETGQLLTGSFMDYGLPRSNDVPFFAFDTNNVPCETNPLGIKGAGEAGTIGATPSVMNAILDAVRKYGITHLDMPATPEKIWQAIQGKAAAE